MNKTPKHFNPGSLKSEEVQRGGSSSFSVSLPPWVLSHACSHKPVEYPYSHLSQPRSCPWRIAFELQNLLKLDDHRFDIFTWKRGLNHTEGNLWSKRRHTAGGTPTVARRTSSDSPGRLKSKLLKPSVTVQPTHTEGLEPRLPDRYFL